MNSARRALRRCRRAINVRQKNCRDIEFHCFQQLGDGRDPLKFDILTERLTLTGVSLSDRDDFHARDCLKVRHVRPRMQMS